MKHGVNKYPSRIVILKDFFPKTVKDIIRALVIIQWFRASIQNLSEKIIFLSEKTKKTREKIKWEIEDEEALRAIT